MKLIKKLRRWDRKIYRNVLGYRITIVHKKRFYFWRYLPIILFISLSLIIANITEEKLQEKVIDYMGLYYVSTGDIWLETKGLTVDEIENTFYHELAHHVWFEILSQEERDNYTRISYSSDPEEDFAENVIAYRNNYRFLEEPRIKKDFVEDILERYGVDVK